MANHTLGRVGLVIRGSYVNGTAYSALDVVDYQGTAYIAKLASTGILPTNTSYWMQAAQASGGTTPTLTLMEPTVGIATGKFTEPFTRMPLAFWIRFTTASNSYMLAWKTGNPNTPQTTNSGGIHTNSSITWSGNTATIMLKNDTGGTFSAAITNATCFGA